MRPRLFEKGKGWFDHYQRAKEELKREFLCSNRSQAFEKARFEKINVSKR